jgi:hypothetical protein
MTYLNDVIGLFLLYQFYVYAIVAGFVSAFLRGFQNKNVAANMKTLSFGTGWLMGVSDVAIMALVGHAGVVIGLFSGFGLGVGYVVSIIVHKRLTRRADKARKQKKRSRLDAKIEDMVHRILDERETPNG